jgi:hypothetical protein
MRPRRTGIAIALILAVGGAVVVAVVLLVTSLAGDPPAGVLQRAELRSSDLPGGYARTVSVAPSDTCSAAQFDEAAVRRMRVLGANACAVTKYRRPAPLGLAGLTLYRFDDARTAARGLAEMRRGYLADVGGAAVRSRHSVPAPELGDEAPRGVKIAIGGKGGGSLYAYFWRRANVVAVLGAGGARGAFNAVRSLALARTVDGRAKG